MSTLGAPGIFSQKKRFQIETLTTNVILLLYFKFLGPMSYAGRHSHQSVSQEIILYNRIQKSSIGISELPTFPVNFPKFSCLCHGQGHSKKMKKKNVVNPSSHS